MCLQEMYLKRPSLCAWWRREGLGFLLSCELIPGNAQGKGGEVSRGALLAQMVKHSSEPWVLCEPWASPPGLQYLYSWYQCLNALACQTEVFIADLFSSWKEVHKQQLPQGGKCPSGGHAPVPTRCKAARVWLHSCGNSDVLVKLGLFVNLLRCLDGWLATDFIGQY